jgi:hypothetical protein
MFTVCRDLLHGRLLNGGGGSSPPQQRLSRYAGERQANDEDAHRKRSAIHSAYIYAAGADIRHARLGQCPYA